MENMKRKRQVSATTIQRYFQALKKIEEVTKNNFVDLKLQSFISDCGINSKIGAILISKGILKQARSIKNSRSLAYKWNTIKPSLQMAKAIIDENRKIEIERGQKIPRENRLKNQSEQKLLFEETKDSFKKDSFIKNIEPEQRNVIEKPARKRKEIKNEEKKEISLFWGLFKYKSNK